jgi:predicted nucleic acid-binding protein
MEAYKDTSALVAAHFAEEKGTAVLSEVRSASDVYSNVFLVAEFLSTIKREGRPWSILDTAIAGISLLFPDRILRAECEEILQGGYLKAPICGT